MLNELATDQLGRNLATIEHLAPRLAAVDTKTARKTAPDASGIMGGSFGPRDPLNLTLVDLEIDARDTLAGWLTNLADDHGFPPSWFTGSVLNLRELAYRMVCVVHHIARAEWGEDCAVEVNNITRRIARALEPDDAEEEPARQRHELTERAAERKVTATDAATICNHIGLDVTADQIRKWRSRGHITEAGRNHHGRLLYRLGDIHDRLQEAN